MKTKESIVTTRFNAFAELKAVENQSNGAKVVCIGTSASLKWLAAETNSRNPAEVEIMEEIGTMFDVKLEAGGASAHIGFSFLAPASVDSYVDYVEKNFNGLFSYLFSLSRDNLYKVRATGEVRWTPHIAMLSSALKARYTTNGDFGFDAFITDAIKDLCDFPLTPLVDITCYVCILTATILLLGSTAYISGIQSSKGVAMLHLCIRERSGNNRKKLLDAFLDGDSTCLDIVNAFDDAAAAAKKPRGRPAKASKIAEKIPYISGASEKSLEDVADTGVSASAPRLTTMDLIKFFENKTKLELKKGEKTAKAGKKPAEKVMPPRKADKKLNKLETQKSKETESASEKNE